jgi:predicted peptidase
VWDWVCRDPKTFAAAVPVCGYGNPVLGRFSPIETAVWAFHGDADNVVPPEGSSRMVEALRKADRAEAKLTLYPGVKHDAWSQTYANPAVYEWMLSKKRATPGEIVAGGQ